ncbi:hypothetical protein [Teichococcus aestuarii]|uniref:hypothetical protein n=1 Tax=Teichococcus aestuarii TaxID=568898 RepID=UPI0036143796
MMRLPAAGLLALALLSAPPLLPGAAKAQPQPAAPPPPLAAVPPALRGPWFAGGCASPTAMLHVTARAVARLPADGPARLIRFAESRAQAGWTVGTGRGAEAPRILLRGDATALQTAEPDAKLRDDRLPGDTPLAAWSRCAAPPPPWPRCMARARRCSARWRCWRRPAAAPGPAAPAASPRWWRRATSRATGCSRWPRSPGWCAA